MPQRCHIHPWSMGQILQRCLFLLGLAITVLDTTSLAQQGTARWKQDYVYTGDVLAAVVQPDPGWERDATSGVVKLKNFNDKVGIGTSSPAQKLDVYGNIFTTGTINANGAMTAFDMTLTGIGSGNVCTSGNGRCTVGGTAHWLASGTNIYNANTGNVGIGTATPTGKLHLAGGDFNVEYNRWLFFLNSTGSANVGGMRALTNSDLEITSNGSIMLNTSGGKTGTYTKLFVSNSGRVGLGTTNPEARFHISENTTAATPYVTGATFWALPRGPNQSHIHYEANGDWYIRSANSSGKVVLQDSGGNVGIGTSNPTAKLHVVGDSLVTGSKSALVETDSYGRRRLYAIESPENWFEDFGNTRLFNGRIVVPIEDIFAQTINTETAYHVFLTPNGNCTLFVSEKSPKAFVVEASNGIPDCAFDYRVVAKRRGYEGLRLEEVRTSLVTSMTSENNR